MDDSTLGSMFPPITATDLAGSTQSQQQQPSMQQALPAGPAGDSFDTMASRMGLDTSGLHKSPDVAKLQLMNQLQQRIGPAFMSHPDVGPLLQAFDQRNQGQPALRNQYTAMSSQGSRTLAALAKVGGNGS